MCRGIFLARLVALAAYAQAVSAALLRLQRAKDVEALAERGFLKQDPKTLNVKKQSFETSGKCTKEFQELASLHDELVAKRARLDATCAAEISHYKKMNTLADVQNRNLKEMVADRLNETDLPPLYREKYATIFCEKVYDGFVMLGDSTSRQDVIEICNGTKSLRECSWRSFGNTSTGYLKVPLNYTELLWTQHYGDLDEHSATSPACSQATSMQKQLNELQNSTFEKTKLCESEKRNLTDDLETKRKEEDDLWAAFHGHRSNKEAIKENASAYVKFKFCSVMQPNITEAAVKSFYEQECVPY